MLIQTPKEEKPRILSHGTFFLMKTALVTLAVLVGLWLLHRAAIWAEDRGWIYYRRQGSPGDLGNAFLELHSILDPGKKTVLEARLQETDEAAESGDPPDKPERSSAT